MLICDPWFHAVFIRQSSGRKRKILEKLKKFKRYRPNNFYARIYIIFYFFFFGVCVCV